MRLAIFPARGGSKRIPRKNVRDFLGKPMIAWPLEEAKSSGLFDHLIVSTDDDEIAEIARSYGAEVPFVRPSTLANDTASTDQVLIHAVTESRRLYGDVEQACCIYPANPFLSRADLLFGLNLLLEHRAISAFPVVRYDFPLEQAFTLDGVRPVAVWPEKLDEISQNLKPYYHDAGMFYWFDVVKFLKVERLFAANSVVFNVPALRCQDINTPEDWEAAEVKFRVLTSLGR